MTSRYLVWIEDLRWAKPSAGDKAAPDHAGYADHSGPGPGEILSIPELLRSVSGQVEILRATPDRAVVLMSPEVAEKVQRAHPFLNVERDVQHSKASARG